MPRARQWRGGVDVLRILRYDVIRLVGSGLGCRATAAARQAQQCRLRDSHLDVAEQRQQRELVIELRPRRFGLR
jgi:hypothetical protein